MQILPVLLSAISLIQASAHRDTSLARWEAEARAVSITRDDWGIAHVRGKTDADAVFGMIYAQAEDDFNRIEINYLNVTRTAGRSRGSERGLAGPRNEAVHRSRQPAGDLHPGVPDWLQRLMTAWADGLNYYLHTHPAVKPKVIARFELLDGAQLQRGKHWWRHRERRPRRFAKVLRRHGEPLPRRIRPAGPPSSPRSNGFAIAPANTVNHRALLLINPHTTFFFRSELQMTSDEGLNAYGAATWGQFFIYQGFNDRMGWMTHLHRRRRHR